MIRKKFFLPGLALIILQCIPGAISANAAGTDYRTPEYYSSTGLEYIHAADAYSLGYTGKGVVVAVVDTHFAIGGEFADKYPYGIIGDNTDPDIHGIHVAGIIAASKDNIGMHGVAFNSQLLAVAGLANWAPLTYYPGINIVSNSWGSEKHIDSIDPDSWSDIYTEIIGLINGARALVRQDKLVIMSAGNEGHLSPSVEAALPSVIEYAGEENNIALNWLSVSAFNPAHTPDQPAFVSFFTNMGKGTSEYNIWAPGTQINSTVSSGTYEKMNGTSMATPYVSGVAALVQEAFPWMGGKQLADVLLSTATPIAGDNQPRFFILYEQPDDDKATTFVAYTATNEPLKVTDEEIDAIVKGVLSGSTDPERIDRVKNLILTSLEDVTVLEQAEYDALFGQGIVNAGKAVKGPGYFNAARLDPITDLSEGEYGGRYALYRIDTRGHSALWSNDIGQRTAKDGELEGLDVGLHKTGEGLLWLTGNNAWKGPTVAAGGGISLGRSDSKSRAALAGDVYVLEGAWFTGNGLVQGNLDSSGLLIPGLWDVSGSRLEVTGKVNSRGITLFHLASDGSSTGIDGSSSVAIDGPLSLATTDNVPFRPWMNYRDVVKASEGLSVSRDDAIVISPFITFRPEITNQTLSLISETTALNALPGLPDSMKGVAGAMEHLYWRFAAQPVQRELDYLYNLSESHFTETAASLRGDIHAATLTMQPFRDNILLNTLPGTGASSQVSEVADNTHRMWMKPLAGYAHFNADGRAGFPDTTLHSRGVILGWEPASGDTRVGVIMAAGHSNLHQGRAKSEVSDTRGGVYLRHDKEALSINGLAILGWQQYSTQRHLHTPGGAKVRSDFHGYSLGLGLDIGWNLLYAADSDFSLTPAIALNLDHVHQSSRREQGDPLYSLNVSSAENTRTTLNPGVRLAYTPQPDTSFSVYAGYRQYLNGHKTGVDVRFSAAPDISFRAPGQPESRGAVTWRAQADRSLSENINVGIFLEGEQARQNQAHHGGVMLEWKW
ncbi:S8 family serine peptidase [Enterobacter ludwigii]|uniref:S8 family serine peptidase n=1 Tax=Enterobacter ludwigii TaxID=299767 RepID=UPI00397604D4